MQKMINPLKCNQLISLLLVSSFLMCLISGCNSTDTTSNSWKIAEKPLLTSWATEVSPENALPEYPRPQMVREDWLNLNGLWGYAIQPKDSGKPTQFQGNILVPYPVESALSGVGKVQHNCSNSGHSRERSAGRVSITPPPIP